MALKALLGGEIEKNLKIVYFPLLAALQSLQKSIESSPFPAKPGEEIFNRARSSLCERLCQERPTDSDEEALL